MKWLSSLFGTGNNDALKQAFQNNALIIDVRSVEEFREGHIKGSCNIPLQDLSKKMDWIKNQKKQVITVCKSGARSSLAKNILSSKGLEVMNGGGWESLNKQIINWNQNQ